MFVACKSAADRVTAISSHLGSSSGTHQTKEQQQRCGHEAAVVCKIQEHLQLKGTGNVGMNTHILLQHETDTRQPLKHVQIKAALLTPALKSTQTGTYHERSHRMHYTHDAQMPPTAVQLN